MQKSRNVKSGFHCSGYNIHRIFRDCDIALLVYELVLEYINHLKMKRRLIYLKTLSVPRCKHFSSRLQKPISLCCKWRKSLFVLR